MRRLDKRVLTAEILLLSFLKTPDLRAHRMLRDFSKERGLIGPVLSRMSKEQPPSGWPVT